MSNRYDNLKMRTKKFSLDIINLVEGLPNNDTCKTLGRQLLRSGTSVGANYRSSCRSRSTADFISKITICEEEADESCFWLELLFESDYISESVFNKMLKEGCELTAIFSASSNTAKKNKNSIKSNNKVKTNIISSIDYSDDPKFFIQTSHSEFLTSHSKDI